jgi:iron(III) transport system permease protein
MKQKLKRWFTRYTVWNAWSVSALLLLLLVATPVLTIVFHLFDPAGPQWAYVGQRLVSTYLLGTVSLLIGVCVLTACIGVGMAWLVTAYDFKGRKWLECALILPLAFPAYMMAYSYVGLLEYTGPVHAGIRQWTGWKIQGPLLDIMNMRGAIFVLSMSLFPYVYVFARTSFQRRSRHVLEASKTLGKTNMQTFFRIALPMARPAIVGGLALVGMEVLNDYGTVKYFGVDTFSTGIFRSWFALGDLSTGIRLAALMMVFVFGFLYAEQRARGQKAWSHTKSTERAPYREILKGKKQVLAWIIGIAVVGLSFLFPLAQMIYWVFLTADKVLNSGFWQLVMHSFLLASGVSLCVVICALVLHYALRINPQSWMRYVVGLAVLGYAVPGAVIAIGIRIPVVQVDRWLVEWWTGKPGLFFSLSLLMLIFAYMVRFMAVGYKAIGSGLSKTGRGVFEASRTLGASAWKTLWRVDLPLLRSSVGAGLLLVFVDIIKELPLTLILRPFNFHTLATKAFDLATNEQVAASANASLVVILIGMIPVLLLNRLMNKS